MNLGFLQDVNLDLGQRKDGIKLKDVGSKGDAVRYMDVPIPVIITSIVLIGVKSCIQQGIGKIGAEVLN